MLCLSIEVGETVYLSGGVSVKVCGGHGRKIKLGFTAPANVQILRESAKVKQVKTRMMTGEPLHAIETDLDYRDNKERCNERD